MQKLIRSAVARLDKALEIKIEFVESPLEEVTLSVRSLRDERQGWSRANRWSAV